MPRLTTKHLMWAILISAMVTGTLVTLKRRDHYLKQATYFESCVAMVERELRPSIKMIYSVSKPGVPLEPGHYWDYQPGTLPQPEPIVNPDLASNTYHHERMRRLNTRKLDYYTQMVEKYRLAASRPWRNVDPDPYLDLSED